MNVVDLIVNTINNSQNGVTFKNMAYNIFCENYQRNIDYIVREITANLSSTYPNGNYPKRTVENLAEYWLLRIALNVLDSTDQRTWSYDTQYAYNDMIRRFNELNVNTVNHNTFTTNTYLANQPTANRSLFTSNSQPNEPIYNQSENKLDVESISDADAMIAFLSQKANEKKQDDQDDVAEHPKQYKVEFSDIGEGDKSSIENFNIKIKTDLGETTSSNQANNKCVDSLKALATEWQEAIANYNASNSNDGDLNQNQDESDKVIEGEFKVKSYNWKLSSFKSMTEEEAVEYRQHELNEAELKQYENIANYSSSVIPIIQEEIKAEAPQPVINTGDLHLVNKLTYLPQSSDISGADEYFNKKHADGKGVITLFGEYGHNSGIYIGDEATRRNILDFNSKIFTINNLDVLVNHIKSSRGGKIMRNSLNCKLVEWVHDMIRMPLRQQTIPLILEGHFKDDLSEYLNHIGLGEEKDSVYDLLMNHVESLGPYMPTFKTLDSIFLSDNHLPTMNVIPAKEWDKCLLGINYTAMVRIPADFKCLGLDVNNIENKHFIGKIDDYKQFFLLEEDIFKIAKTIDSSIKNIRLIIADSSGHVVNFKRVEEPIAIMKIEER